ncbi:MAG: hypothetical protein AAGD00_09225 [Planctomycetota bacterium]
MLAPRSDRSAWIVRIGVCLWAFAAPSGALAQNIPATTQPTIDPNALVQNALQPVQTAQQQAQQPQAQPAPPAAAPAPNVAPQGAAPAEEDDNSYSVVRVSEFLTVDMFVNNAELRDVLQQLAIQTRRNIVPSGDVGGNVTANVFGVSFYDALEALLNANGFAFIERGDFIFVYTMEEAEQIRDRERGFVTRVLHLDHLPATEAVRFTQHLVSEDGRMEATQDAGSDSGGGDGLSLGGEVTSESGRVYQPTVDEFAMTNAVVVYDYEDRVREIERLLLELDTRPAQVLVEATIVQAMLTEANAFGVDFALISDVQFNDFFGLPGSFNPLGFVSEPEMQDPMNAPPASTATANREEFFSSVPGQTGSENADFRAGFVINDDIAIFLRALDRVTDTTLLANPKVMTLNRQRGYVLVGQRVGYLETFVVENQILQTVSFIDTGIQLDFRPYVGKDETVRIELSPQVSSVSFRSVTTASGINQDIPDEDVQQITTHVTIPKDSTAVLGGLFTESTTLERRQVPVLGDIPLIGNAFRGYDDNTIRNEIIFLVKPTVMNDRMVIDAGEDAVAFSDQVRVGSRQGLLPWSRERQSTRLNVEAERYAAEGDIERAMWAIRRSLELNPVQPEAIRIRERLVKNQEWWPRASMLDQMFDSEIDSAFPGLTSEQPAPVEDN